MKYTVKWIENKPTSAGKMRAIATVVDETGVETADITIWGDYPGFQDLRPAAITEATIEQKTINGKVWRALRAVRTDTLSAPAYRKHTGPKPDMLKAVEKKQEGITTAMDRKDDSIKRSSIFRDSTIMTNAFVASQSGEMTLEDMQAVWDEWHKWLDARYDSPF